MVIAYQFFNRWGKQPVLLLVVLLKIRSHSIVYQCLKILFERLIAVIKNILKAKNRLGYETASFCLILYGLAAN
jgi:hypothetical protein